MIFVPPGKAKIVSNRVSQNCPLRLDGSALADLPWRESREDINHNVPIMVNIIIGVIQPVLCSPVLGAPVLYFPEHPPNLSFATMLVRQLYPAHQAQEFHCL